MDFYQAEEQFRRLEMQRRTRQISDEQYRAALAQLRVSDMYGRLWMLQEGTGQWHVYDGGRWVPATPPQPVAPPPPPAPVPGPAAAGGGGSGCGRFALYALLWVGIWLAVAVAVYIWKGREEPMILAGVGVAALLSLLFLVPQLLSHWEGQIIDLRTERVKVQRGDDDWDWEEQTFAYVRQPSGRMRKERAMPGWRVGDRLVKRQGEAFVRKV